MGTWGLRAVFLLLTITPCLGQNASVSVSANSGLGSDRRPFGKYLVETCTLTGGQLTLSCTKVPYPADEIAKPKPCSKPAGPCNLTVVPQWKDQTVTIKVVCDPAQKTTPCDLANPKLGDDFFVSATADSGLPVQQKVIVGNATPLGGSRTVQYRAIAVGPIIIRAIAPQFPCAPGQKTQACDYAASPPVDLILQIGDDPAAKSEPCPVLPPSVGTQSKPLDAPTIVSLLGNPTPFILSAQGSNTIFIYATRWPLKNDEFHDEIRTLGSFQQAIAELAGRTVASLGITPPAAKPFTVELKIPHASALGDLATWIGGLNSSQFTVQDVGRGSVRVTAPTQPDCETWTAFLTDIRGMAWRVVSSPMSTKLYYLSSSDVATAFSGLTPPVAASGVPASSTSPTSLAGSSAPSSSSASPAATATTPSAASSTAPSGVSSATSGGTSSTGATTTPSATPSAVPAAASSSSNATIAITQPPGSNIQISSDTTPCVVAGLAFGNNTTCGSAPASATGAGPSSASAMGSSAAATPAATGPLSMASVAVAAGTGEQTPPDLLVYSDTNPGDDSQIAERNRVLAQLDLPRPEMILSAWVTQNSTTSPEAMGAFNNMVKRIDSDYNDEYEKVILKAWLSLKQQRANRNYFNEAFRSYIADRFVADTYKDRKTGGNVQDLSQAFLDQSQAKMADPVFPAKRTDLGICERGRYCLGYNGLFRHAFVEGELPDPSLDNVSLTKPVLTDLLFAIIAAQEPVKAAERAIDNVEGIRSGEPGVPDPHAVRPNMNESYCDNGAWLQTGNRYRGQEKEVRQRCHAIWRYLDLDHVSPPPQTPSCEDKDFRGILGSLLTRSPEYPEDTNSNEPRVYLECFRRAARLLLPATCGDADCNNYSLKTLLPSGITLENFTKQFQSDNSTTTAQPPYGVGLFRAAIADFLFDYKMSQQYPHEFVAYDLTQSANNLNNALSPLIDAFSRDLWSYQMFVRADMQYQVEKLNARWDQRCCVKRLFGIDKPSFFNDGLVTVRTISGQPTSVSTTSQSFLNGSTAPELSSLLSSLSGGGGGGSLASSGNVTATISGIPGTSSSTPGGGGGGAATPLGLLTSALANYQTSYAQVGRQLSFTATPRTLATASSAELTVTLNADESAGGPLYTGPSENDPAFNTSRVANHDTSTRVRVDSIKLFEVSSFSAIVERSRSRFPLLPPFVEIPYIGTFAGIPLGSAKEFHSSTAIVSAYVIPTAADIAYGLRFVSDLVVDGPKGPCSFYKGAAGPDVTNVCVFRYPNYAWHDLPEQPIREFNRNITRCFATDTSSEGCLRRVSFDNALRTQ